MTRGGPSGDDEPFDAMLDAARRSDPQAWSQLFHTYAPRIAGYLRAQGARDVDDLTSEVFLGVLQAIAGFTGDEAAFRSWLFVIAHRRLTDERRRHHRRPDPGPIDDDERGLPAGGDAEVDAHRALGTQRAIELCRHLSDDQRDVLLLRIVADLPLEDVADVLAKTVGAVKSLQHRGLATLERTISKQAVSR